MCIEIFRMFFTIYPSQQHIGILSCIWILRAYLFCQCSCFDFVELFEFANINNTDTIDSPGFFELFIDPYCTLEILRLNEQIKTLGIEIALNCIAPFFIVDFEIFAKRFDMNFAPGASAQFFSE